MNSSHRTFRINIGFLINQPIGYARNFVFDTPIAIQHDDYVLNNIIGAAEFSRIQQGLHIQADFSALLQMTCVRCLEEYQQILHAVFEEIFTFKGHPLSEDEQEVPEDGYIDIEPLLIDYLFLEIPIKPVCKENCFGLCIICGQNLNQTFCEHQKLVVGDQLPGKEY